MASTEQPLKKRKLHEPLPLEPLTTQPQPTTETPLPRGADVVEGPPTPPPLTQDEILRRRRNQEEIRNVYQSYKIIKRCASKEDPRLMAELEQAYLSLITASRGCTSVQRIVSEFIPRYASYCPTALEAAAQVVINMHNWSLPVVSSGEDLDGVAFETAKNCIVGLVDICCAAASEAPTSSVIRGICSAVFLNVLTFFASSFEGKDIFQIVGKETLEIQDSADLFAQLKRKVSEEDGSALLKLSKLRALSLLRIFFCCPKNVLSACFELLNTPSSDGHYKEGKYFLSQLSCGLASDNEITKPSNGDEESTIGMEVDNEVNGTKSERQVSDGDHVPANVSHVSKNCLMRLVIRKDPSLKRWMFSRYKKLCNSAPSPVVSEITIGLQEIFDSFTDLLKEEYDKEDSDEDISDPSKHVNRQYLVQRISNQRKSSADGKDFTLRAHDTSCDYDLADKFSVQYLKHHNSMVSLENDHHSSTSSNNESGGSKSKSMDFESKEQLDVCDGRYSIHREPLTKWSPHPRKLTDSRTDLFEGGDHPVPVDNNQASNVDALRYSSGNAGNVVSRNHTVVPNPPNVNQIFWYSDGDPAAMDVFSASSQLWLGFLPPDASEASLRFQLERFGPIKNSSFFPVKGFAIVEYRSIMDAIKARECMRNQSPWGTLLRVKFMDIGLGTRGAVNGVAIGYSCHVYVGNVSSHWVKDEILHEMMKVVYRGPRAVIELTSEAALLLEFETPEEAANAMACIRQHRNGNNNYTVSFSAGPADMLMSHTSFAIPASAHINNGPGNMSNSMLGLPHFQMTAGSPADRMRLYGADSVMVNPDCGPPEFASPSASFEKHGMTVQSEHVLHSNWPVSASADIPEVGATKCDGYGSNGMVASSQGGTSEMVLVHMKPELESHPAARPAPCMPIAAQGPVIAPLQQIQGNAYMRPVYLPPGSSWDARGLNHLPLNTMPPGGGMPNNLHTNSIPPPFIPVSVTPLSQLQGHGIQQYSQMVPQAIVPALSPCVQLPKTDMQPPLPPSPPIVPPPPSSPPPPPPPPDFEASDLQSPGNKLQIQWQGTLSKSGVHYCTIYAYRMDSGICKYSNDISEPAEWPGKLDMTKRTDFRHVKSTFSNTPSHRREVCQLLPFSPGDHKGFQDFISYLKQRECAGVIKIPAVKSIWARLLFILPYSPEACSMLSVSPNPTDCLIALVLPKETNCEWPASLLLQLKRPLSLSEKRKRKHGAWNEGKYKITPQIWMGWLAEHLPLQSYQNLLCCTSFSFVILHLFLHC
ncbi:hypothetical protein Nepgr_019817 [Nepenthes gracilis]|uniref:RRM domain-containing protein n=1 Tax=Nepenthes gracilis TaxID=150966 RepID=A0AAD3SXS8_NEPGR|nr:hypothetical protein Nepgr_019817 [Nepenthes gracilis]